MPHPIKPGFYGFKPAHRPGYDMIAVVQCDSRLYFNYEGEVHNVGDFPENYYTDMVEIEDALNYIDNKTKEK